MGRRGGYVLLEDGASFGGELCGAEGEALGEVVFTTGMSGYQESMTDPSFASQLIVFTYPHIGNYGVSAQAMESERVWARAAIMREACNREDAPSAELVAHSEERPGAYNGRYEAGSVWAVLDGSGSVEVVLDDGPAHARVEVTHAGAYALVEHERHTAGTIEISPGDGVRCHATCFLPGLA